MEIFNKHNYIYCKFPSESGGEGILKIGSRLLMF